MKLDRVSNALPLVRGRCLDAVEQLRLLDERYLVAQSTGNRAFLERILGDDFLLLDASGQWLDRNQQLARSTTLAIKSIARRRPSEVRIVGETALVHGASDSSVEGAGSVMCRHTNAYQRRRGSWQLVGAQQTRVHPGVPPAQQRGVPMAPLTWHGADPVGHDIDVLHRLNESYVQAFRCADVAWYDAHLAPEFVVVGSDGSFEDRASALVGFARPDFATRLRSFEIDNVRIRRFGDVALVHADALFEAKQGGWGANSYTDAWRKTPGGRWLCMSAHITGRELLR